MSSLRPNRITTDNEDPSSVQWDNTNDPDYVSPWDWDSDNCSLFGLRSLTLLCSAVASFGAWQAIFAAVEIPGVAEEDVLLQVFLFDYTYNWVSQLIR